MVAGVTDEHPTAGLLDDDGRGVGGVVGEGVPAEFAYSWQAIGKQLKLADKKGVSAVIMLGADSTNPQLVRIKKMAGGQEREVALDELLADPRRVLEQGW